MKKKVIIVALIIIVLMTIVANIVLTSSKTESTAQVEKALSGKKLIYKKRIGFIYGDADEDGEVTTRDTNLIQQYILNKTSFNDINLEKADVNGDGEITSADATEIQQYILNKSYIFSIQYVNDDETIQAGEVLILDVDGSEVSTWSSSNEGCLTIDEKGYVSAKKQGKTTITAVLTDKTEINFDITVEEKTEVQAIHIIKENSNLGDINGDGKVTMTDYHMVQQYLLDKSSIDIDEEKADVDGDGDITADDLAEIEQKVYVNSYHFTAEYIESTVMEKGETLTLNSYIEPTTAEDKTVTWSSSNEEIATVDKNGMVTAISKGTVEITVTANDGGYTDTCIIKIKDSSKVKPTIKVLDPDKGSEIKPNKEGWHNQNVKIEFGLVDGIELLDIWVENNKGKGVFDLDGCEETTTCNIGEDGIYIATVEGFDSEGNYINEETLEIKVDKTAPEVCDIEFIGQKETNEENYHSCVTAKITGSSDEGGSGIASEYINVEKIGEEENDYICGFNFKSNTKYTFTEIGTYNLTILIIDNAGNRTTKTNRITIEDLTLGKPTIKVLDPDKGSEIKPNKEGWYNENVKIEFGLVDGIDLLDIWVENNEGKEIFNSDGCEETTTCNIEEDGIYIATVKGFDSKGNYINEETLEIKVDKTAPTVKFDPNGLYVKAGDTITITVEDFGSGVLCSEDYGIRLNDGELEAEYEINENYLSTKSVTKIDNGYKIEIQIDDNYQEGDTIKIGIDVGDRLLNGETVYKTYKFSTTSYTEKTYQMNTNGEYELIKEEKKYGIAGEPVTMSIEGKEGFTYDESKSTAEGTIAADGSTELTVYYTRNSYTVSLTAGTGIASVTLDGEEENINVEADYRYQKEIEIKAETKIGYTWENWTGTTTIEEKDTIITIPAGNVELTANATAISYTIEYDLAGGSLEEGRTNPESYTVETERFTLANPIREGYIFKGWTGSNEDTARTEVTVEKGTTGNLSYVANWEKINIDEKYFTSDIYSIDTETMYISKILPSTTYEEFKKHIFTNMEYTVLDVKDGHTVGNTKLIKTGDKLEVDGKQYQLVVTGDINQNGECDISDLAKQKRNIIKEIELTGAQLKAADVNYDGEANLTDLSKMVKYIIGLINF